MKSRRGQLLDALSDLVDQLDDTALETLVCAAKMTLKPGSEFGSDAVADAGGFDDAA